MSVHVVVSSSGTVYGVYSDPTIAERHVESLRDSRDGEDYEVSSHVIDE